MSQARTWVISDTHFGHHNILKFEMMARGPFEDIYQHDREIVERWNALVKPKDTVWHLGDVYFGPKESEHALEILKALAGYKRLVMGNHDVNREDILRHFFDRIYGVAEYGRCILSHVPVHPYQLEKRYTKNIHGHMHSKRVQKGDYDFGIPGDDERYVCVSVEHTDLKPVLLQTVIQHGLLG